MSLNQYTFFGDHAALESLTQHENRLDLKEEALVTHKAYLSITDWRVMNKYYIILFALSLFASVLSYAVEPTDVIDAQLRDLKDLQVAARKNSSDNILFKLVDQKICHIRNYVWINATDGLASLAVEKTNNSGLSELKSLADNYRITHLVEDDQKIPVFMSIAELDDYIKSNYVHEESNITRLFYVPLRNRLLLTVDYDAGKWKNSAAVEAFRRFGLEVGYIQYPISMAY
jgi:hypothetical protein